jgi:uncharacterized phage protein (TIGR01671 family)
LRRSVEVNPRIRGREGLVPNLGSHTTGIISLATVGKKARKDMREIKFRAWIQEYEDIKPVMLEMPMNLINFDYENGWVLAFTDYAEFYGHEAYMERKPNMVNIMQFTGLKDKNGVEIFEGDLLQWNADKDAHYEVFYHDDECRFKCCRVHYHGSRCGGMIPDITSPNLHVIGNKYESPQLLAQEIKNVTPS